MDPVLRGKSLRIQEEPPASDLALFGAAHSNPTALQEALGLAATRGVDRLYGLGDLIGLGPDPEGTLRLVLDRRIPCLQGDFEVNLSLGVEEIDCDFTSPSEVAMSQVGLSFVERKLSPEMIQKLSTFPHHIRTTLGEHRVLLVHGSPALIGESCWESREDIEYVDWFQEHQADIIVCDHTGLPWFREIARGRWMINVGSVGRPANDGRREGRLVVLRSGDPPSVEFVPVPFDWARVAEQIKAERLPEEVWRTIEEGFWHYSLETLPPLERARGRY